LILRFHQGDWHVAADKHREWVETWIRKAPVAAKYAEGLGWHYFLMKHQDGLESFTYADIPAMARAAKHVGCSHLMLFGWHAPGHDNRYMYDYKPNPDWGGEEALRAGIEEARAMGVEVIPFFNGTLANSMLPEHQEFGHRWEAKSREGHPLYAGDWSGFSRDTPSVFRSRIHYEICPCEDSQDFLLRSAHNIVEDFGFANLQLDQLGIKVYPCYNEDHHHRHPDRACIDGFTELLDQLRPFVDRVNPEGVLISECANEFTGQWCNGAWTWDFDGTPEPVLYAVPWLLTSTEIDALEYAEANRAFARKILMDVRIAGGDEYVTEYPGFAEHLRALAQLKRKATAHYVYADFRDREGLVGDDPDGVIIRTFLNRAEKKAGIVVANMSDERRTVVVDHEWAPTGSCLLWSSTGLEKEITDTGKITLDLDKYEVNILGLNLGGAGLKK
nr:DUF6259 domain-containing protein [Denitromonas sp.]